MTTKQKQVPGSFNADERAAVRAQREIIIGGQTFHPRKRTMQMMAEWSDATPNADEAQDPDRDPMDNFRDVFKQLRVFLVNDEHEVPDQEFLESELDVEEAVDLLISLQPTLSFEQERARDLAREADETAT
jgi:hypothetical protein